MDELQPGQTWVFFFFWYSKCSEIVRRRFYKSERTRNIFVTCLYDPNWVLYVNVQIQNFASPTSKFTPFLIHLGVKSQKVWSFSLDKVYFQHSKLHPKNLLYPQNHSERVQSSLKIFLNTHNVRFWRVELGKSNTETDPQKPMFLGICFGKNHFPSDKQQNKKSLWPAVLKYYKSKITWS